MCGLVSPPLVHEGQLSYMPLLLCSRWKKRPDTSVAVTMFLGTLGQAFSASSLHEASQGEYLAVYKHREFLPFEARLVFLKDE